MIRFILSNKKYYTMLGTILAIIISVCVFAGIDDSKSVQRVALNYYSFEGSISYVNDSDWKNVIRPMAFDDNLMSLDLYSGSTFIKNVDLQSTALHDDYHLSFVHDGYGGGGYVVSNIPSIVDSEEVTMCKLRVKNMKFYEDASSNAIEFSEEVKKVLHVSVQFTPHMIPLNICEKVEGESEDISATFSVNVKAINNINSKDVASTTTTKGIYVYKSTEGTTLNVPVGLKYNVTQVSNSGYTLKNYSLSYITEDSSGKETETSIQGNVSSLSQFEALEKRDSKNVKKYKVTIVNAAKNAEVKWNVVWLDNHNPNRPNAVFKLQYSVNGSAYADITQSVISSLGMSQVPQCVEEENISSEDIFTYSYSNLPNINTSGQTISYKLVQQIQSDEYMTQYDSSTSTYYNSIKTNFVAAIKWLDSDADISKIRPEVSQVKNNLKLYKVDNGVYTNESLTSSDITIQKSGENDKDWLVIINKDLPQYSKNNSKYTYVLIEGTIDTTGKATPISTIKKNGYTGEELYNISYYNSGSTEVKSDRCYAEQLILHTLKSPYEFTATKVWKDGEDAQRPETIVTLWRYPMPSSTDTTINLSESARVIAQDKEGNDVVLQYKLATAGSKVSELTMANKNSEQIVFDETTIPSLSDSFELPKYDLMGNEYLYFVVETQNSDNLEEYYESTYINENNLNENIGVTNEGTINSARAGRVALEINKLWNVASSADDIEGAKITFKVLGKSKGSSSYNEIGIVDGSATMVDFGATKLKDKIEVLINPYDSNGQLYEDIKVQEAEINIGGRNLSITLGKGEQGGWTFSTKENDYEGTGGDVKPKGHSVIYGIEKYATNITNTLTTNKDYSVVVIWEADIDRTEYVDQKLWVNGVSVKHTEEGEEPYSVDYFIKVIDDAEVVNGVKQGTATLVDKDGNELEVGYVETAREKENSPGEMEILWTIGELPWLKKFDSEGYLMEYRVTWVENEIPEGKEVQWESSYSTNSEGSVIRNTKIKDNAELIHANKLWLDGGDATSEYEVHLVVTDPLDANIEPQIVKLNGSNFWQDTIKFEEDYFKSAVLEGSLEFEEIMIDPKNPEGDPYTTYTLDGKTYISTDKFTYEVEYREYNAAENTDDNPNPPDEDGDEGGEIYVLGIDITNRRIDTVEMVINNIWKDGKNQSATRPEYITYEIVQYDFYGRECGTRTIQLDSRDEDDDGNWCKKVDGLPKYDEYGRAYEYFVNELPVYTYPEGVSHDNEYRQKMEYDFKFGQDTLPKGFQWGQDKTYDTITYTCTNYLEATRSFYIYQKWRDEDISNEDRPDMYMSVFRKNGEGGIGTSIPVESSFKNQIWTAGGEGDNYTWRIEFLNLDKYDAEGYLCSYYVEERINEASDTGLKYNIEYGDKDGNIISANYADEDGYIINTVYDNIVINGEKIWKNIAGYLPSDLPSINIDLFRKDPEGNELMMDSVLLENGATIFSFDKQVIENDDGTTTEVDLQKYTATGQAYKYYLKEHKEDIIAPDQCTEGADADIYNLYSIRHDNYAIINEFNRTTNLRSIVVTKKWNRERVDIDNGEENIYPAVTLKLYRYISTGNISNTNNMEHVQTITTRASTFAAATDGVVDIKFDDVLIYSPKGQRYKYFVCEQKISDAYTTEYSSENTSNGITTDANGIYFSDVIRMTDADRVSRAVVTNTFDGNNGKEIQGTKIWNDYYNFYGIRPDSINIVLSRGAAATDGNNRVPEIVLNMEVKDAKDENEKNKIYVVWDKNVASGGHDTWKFTIYNLPKYAANGQTYTYYVREDDDEVEKFYANTGRIYANMSGLSAGANSLWIGSIENYFAVTHTVKKHWIDGNNQYNLRPKNVTMELEFSSDGGTTWNKMLRQDGSTTVISSVLTSRDVVANTRGNTWRDTFDYLPPYQKIKVGNTGTDEDYQIKRVQYRCVETKVGENAVPDTMQVGAYVVSEPTVSNNTTEIKNSMQSTKLTVTKEWDDEDNYYQTRFNKTHYRLEAIAQYAVVIESSSPASLEQSGVTENSQSLVGRPMPTDEWTQVYDVDGKPLVFELTSDDLCKDENGEYNWWQSTFYNLPVARVGDPSKGEDDIVKLYYRVVECTNADKNPQLVSVTSSGGTYNIVANSTYKNYEDATDYDNFSWQYDSDEKANYSHIVNHMITKDDVTTRTGDDLVTVIAAEKRWAKDASTSGYAVTIELKYATGTSTSYYSFSTSLRKSISYNGSGVSWGNLPAYNASGQTLKYKAVELTTSSRFRVDTQIETTDLTIGKIEKYIFTNIELMSYVTKAIWNNNDRTLSTSEKNFSSTSLFQRRITETGEWENVTYASDGSNVITTLTTSYRTTYSVQSTRSNLDRYTVDNKRIYYRSIETHVNGVEVANNKAYIYSNVDAELDGDVYTDDGKTELYHTLRTESLGLTKYWDDDNNCDGVRPTINSSAMKFTLYADLGSGYTVVPTSFYTLSWVLRSGNENVWEATIRNLPKYTKTGGTIIQYKIVETTVPSRYFISRDFEMPEFEDGIDEYYTDVTNTLNLLVYLKKYDAVNNKALQGTQFELYKLNDSTGDYTDKVGSTMTAGSNGYINFELNKTGYYMLIETKAVKGYEMLLDEEGKTDLENGNPFTSFFSVEDFNLRQTAYINSDSTYEIPTSGPQPVSVSNEVESDYTAAAWLLKDFMTFGVIEGWYDLVTSDGLINKRKLGELTFTKQDYDTAKKLNGVTFSLYRYANEDGSGSRIHIADIETGQNYVCSETGNLVISEDTSRATNDGVIHISKLPWGYYVLEETQLLSGYYYAGGTWTYYVNASTVNDTTGINENISIKRSGSTLTNNVITNRKTVFVFYKRGYTTGSSSRNIYGGKFKIVSNDAARTEQKFWVNVYSDDESKKVSELESYDYVYGLPIGSYRLVEVETPYGYKKAPDVVFGINESGYIVNASGSSTGSRYLYMYDDPIRLNIINVDEDFITPINGSTFELTGQFANTYGDSISSKTKRTCTISDLKWQLVANIQPSYIGKTKYVYKLEQTSVPVGYELQSQVVYFILNENYQLELTDENGNAPSQELQELYDLFLKVDNTSTTSTITFENLRIPVNDIYILNGETYLDSASGNICKLFYAYDHVEDDTRLGEGMQFWVDKTNLGKPEFAVTTSPNGTDKTAYVESKYIIITDSKGNRLEASEDNMYKLDEDEIYTLEVATGYLNGIKKGSRMLYLYSHMPRIDDTEGVYIVRRTSFKQH